MFEHIIEILTKDNLKYFIDILKNGHNIDANFDDILEYSDVIEKEILPSTSFIVYSDDGTKFGSYDNCPPNIPTSENLKILVVSKSEVQKYTQPIVINNKIEEYEECEFDEKTKKYKKLTKTKLNTKILSETVEKALNTVDGLSNVVRSGYITTGSSQSQIYNDKYEDAIAFINTKNPNIDDYPYLKNESEALNIKPKTLANKIINKRNECRLINAKIEAIRLAAKKEIKKIKSVEEINKYMDSVTAQLNELKK